MDGQKVINCLEEVISYLFVHNYDMRRISELLCELRKEYGLAWEQDEESDVGIANYRDIQLYRGEGGITAYFMHSQDPPFFHTGSESHAVELIDQYYSEIEMRCSKAKRDKLADRSFEIEGWLFVVDFDAGYNPFVKRYKYIGSTSK